MKIEKVLEEALPNLRKASEILGKTLSILGDIVKPNIKIVDISEKIEQEITNMGAIWAFPVNICIDSIAAHYTPLIDEETVIGEDDVVKIDFGVAVNGYIVDKAVTYYFGQDDEKKALIETAKEALDKALSVIKPGTSFSELAYLVYDYVKSRGFKVIRNLHGHKIERWKLHTDVEIPIHPESRIRGKFEKGGVYAIEIFVTNGDGYVESTDDLRIFSLPQLLADVERFKLPIHLKIARQIFHWVFRNRKTLPFSKRHLQKNFDERSVRIGLAVLERYGLITRYFVLKEKKGGVVAQVEDTVVIKKDGVEILTRPISKKLEKETS